MEPSYRAVQITITVINVLSIAACIWMFNLFSKAKEKSISFFTIIIMLGSNFVFNITNISEQWSGDFTTGLEVTHDLSLYSSLFWSVTMSYLVYKASQFAFLPTEDSFPHFNWFIFGSFMSACVWVTIKRAGGLGFLPVNIVLGLLVGAVFVLYIMALLKIKNPPSRGMTSSVKSEIKIWGASFVCAAIFLGIGTMTAGLLNTTFSMWLLLLTWGLTGISSFVIAVVYKFSVYTEGGSSSGNATNSRGPFAGRGYTLM